MCFQRLRVCSCFRCRGGCMHFSPGSRPRYINDLMFCIPWFVYSSSFVFNLQRLQPRSTLLIWQKCKSSFTFWWQRCFFFFFFFFYLAGWSGRVLYLTRFFLLSFFLPCPRSGAGFYIASVFSSSSFCQHRYFSFSLHGMTMLLIHIH